MTTENFVTVSSTSRGALLDPGLDLTLRPMRYPFFYERFRDAIKNTWTVEEVDLHSDLSDLERLTPAERHLIERLVAFFATGDTIVANNLVLNLYEHVNAPEAVENIPSIRAKAKFAYKWIGALENLGPLKTSSDRRTFLLNLICFAACIEGLFFYGAFAYVYFLRSRGLLNGLASGTNWVFRDESMHMAFAFDVIDVVRAEEPELFDVELAGQIKEMMLEAVDAEYHFAQDLLGGGVAGMTVDEMRGYLEFVADQRMTQLGLEPIFGTKNPFAFMELQDVQELSNFFERRVSAYQVGVTGSISFDETF
jgi:ribonucleoside-diphosphate reductase beta chain